MPAVCRSNRFALGVQSFYLDAGPTGFETIFFTHVFAESFAYDEDVGLGFETIKSFLGVKDEE